MTITPTPRGFEITLSRGDKVAVRRRAIKDRRTKKPLYVRHTLTLGAK
jgi:hypothetical protein